MDVGSIYNFLFKIYIIQGQIFKLGSNDTYSHPKFETFSNRICHFMDIINSRKFGEIVGTNFKTFGYNYSKLSNSSELKSYYLVVSCCNLFYSEFSHS